MALRLGELEANGCTPPDAPPSTAPPVRHMVAVVRVAAPYYPPRDHLWRFELGERVRAKGGAIGVVVARGYHVQVTSEDGRTVAREWPEVLVEHMDPSGAICWEWVGELDAEPARWHTERIAERYAAILAGVELVGL